MSCYVCDVDYWILNHSIKTLFIASNMFEAELLVFTNKTKEMMENYNTTTNERMNERTEKRKWCCRMGMKAKRLATITFSSHSMHGKAIMSDNDGAGYNQYTASSDTDDDVMVTMNNCEMATLASLSFRQKATNKKVMWNLTWSKLRDMHHGYITMLCWYLKFDVTKVHSEWWHWKLCSSVVAVVFCVCLSYFELEFVQVNIAHRFRFA